MPGSWYHLPPQSADGSMQWRAYGALCGPQGRLHILRHPIDAVGHATSLTDGSP